MSANGASWSIFSFYPIGSHTRIAVDTVQTVVITYNTQIFKAANAIIIQAEVGTVRYTLDGSTPTATFGFRLGVNDGALRLDLPSNLPIKFIGEAAGNFINYQLLSVS